MIFLPSVHISIDSVPILSGKFTCKCTRTRQKFIEVKPNAEAYGNPFYCRTIREWNSLPSNVLDIGETSLLAAKEMNKQTLKNFVNQNNIII